jgi:multidrug efflux pump subunit AcrA (membrane-fusion protein)
MALSTRNSNQTLQPNLDISNQRNLGIRSRIVVGSLATLLLVGGFGGWAATAELTGAVVGQGQVIVDKDLRAIQHLDGGIIRTIDVRKGDAVKEGQVLFTLDSTQMTAESEIMHGQMLDGRARWCMGNESGRSS